MLHKKYKNINNTNNNKNICIFDLQTTITV